VSFFYYDSDGEDEYYLSRGSLIGYINLECIHSFFLWPWTLAYDADPQISSK